MAHTTVSFTPITDTAFYTVAQLNTMFAAIKTVVDAKLDVRGDTIGATIAAAAPESVQVINILPTSEILTS